MGVSALKKAIFLDRDGVLNEAILQNGVPYPPSTLSELKIPPGVQTALDALKSAGFLLIGATNQPDVARGKTTRAQVERINSTLMGLLPLDEIAVCYHDDNDHCTCRKPQPGLLKNASLAHGIDLNQSYMIGDRWKDIEAGINAGCKTIWLYFDYQEKKPSKPADFVTDSLVKAAEWILKA